MTDNEFISLRKKIIEKDFVKLNSMQKEAVFSTEGPLLVLAGAGSGKTTVLVNRIANIVKYGKAYYSDYVPSGLNPFDEAMLFAASQGAELPENLMYLMQDSPAKPWQILAITFTNKAAGELKERLETMLGPDANDIWASTFHSACVRILRKNHEYLGYTSNFTIYDTDDSKRVIKDCMKALGLSDKIISPKTVIFEISKAKDYLISPDEYIQSYQNDYLKRNIGAIYKEYQNKLKQSDAMDFDDIICNTVVLLKSQPEVLEYYQNKFKYIVIDEYQDTNNLQYLLVSLLAGKYKNICVVGDDDQSIYRFRGATIENILNFESEYQNAKVIRLEQNYRSTQNILDAANKVISNNEKRKGKNLWTDNGAGDKLIFHKADSDRDEGYFVTKRILYGIKNGKNYSDYAVLYRMNSQSNLIEQSFVQNGIPYRIIGGHKFYDRKEIKDCIAYLSVIANPNDSVRMSRIINEPKRGIGDTTYSSVNEISSALNIDLLEIMEEASKYPKLSRSAKKLEQFAEMIKGFISYSEVNSISSLLKYVLEETGYIASLDLEPERKQDRLENIDQLINNIDNFCQNNEDATLNDFLQEISLMTDIDNYNSEADSVVMMTIHSAKGLEFENVFLVGMEENIFPSQLSIDEGEAGIEEERRLAYVAITRAKKKLFISCSQMRMLFGATRYNPPSRFITEIPDSLIEPSEENKAKIANSNNGFKKQIINNNFERKPQARTSDYGFSGVSKPAKKCNLSFKIGDTVIHKTWGKGTVLSITPMANDTLLEVAFLNGPTKKIMANYAKLEKVNQ